MLGRSASGAGSGELAAGLKNTALPIVQHRSLVRARGHRDGLGLGTLGPVVRHLVCDVRAASVAPHVEVPDVVRVVIGGMGDRRGIEQVDQSREGIRLAVVGRGAGEDERVGAAGQ